MGSSMDDYHINLFAGAEDGGYVADIPDHPCSVFGNTPEPALAEAQQAKAAWLQAAKDMGKPIPLPTYRPAIYQAS